MRLSPHPARAGPSGLITQGPTIRSTENESSAGPLTAAMAAASSLSIGWGVVVIVVVGVHLTMSAPFRAGSQGSVSGRLSETAVWRARPSCPGFPLRFRCRRWLFGHPVPAEGLGVPCGRRTSAPGDGTGPRRGFRVSHARAAIGVGALSTPGTTVLALTGVARRPALAASQRRVPALRRDVASMRSSALRSITKGSRVFTRPIFPLPVAPGCNGSVLGFTPSFAPRPCGRRTSRWGQVIEHGPETTLYVIDLASNPALFSQCVRPRVARDDAEASESTCLPMRASRVRSHR